jgi:hypothetical protein
VVTILLLLALDCRRRLWFACPTMRAIGSSCACGGARKRLDCAVARLLSGGVRRLPAAAAALLRPPQRGDFRLHARSGSRTMVGYADTHFAMLPFALFVLWPSFWLHSALGVTPLFIVGAALSSAIMIGIIVSDDPAVGRRRDFEQCRALLGRRERSAGTKGLDLETWNNQSQSNKCKWNN